MGLFGHPTPHDSPKWDAWAARGLTEDEMRAEMDGPRVCGFCKGKPVGNAESWLDGKPRPPAACPRCGETNYPKESTT